MRLGPVRRRRWRWISAGVLLVALGAGANVAIGLSQQEQVAVLAADRDLSAGHVLAEEDVRVVRLDGAAAGLGLVEARSHQAFGKRLAVPLTDGTPLNRSALGAKEQYPPQDQAIVSAAVGPGVLPGSAEEGSPVAAIITPASGAPGDQAPQETDDGAAQEAPGAQGRSVPARIHRVQQADAASSATTVVELVVQAPDAQAVARAAGEERLRLALVSRTEGGL
ncbi:SAF domain-containing protein [Streptomonospora salina]|uniref:Flp pilus assembly protein CpaB n=1 Tax=Streptomonospora salina TaxID=104205 RepID=A0A841EFI8_9ACTN|nr:SAF domain-containing protein [Streptomonospora salina]MBB6000099.1 Flp pilus assembly protein CpaB [Streptomonospora salina]